MPEKPDEYCRSKLILLSNDFSFILTQNGAKSPFLKKFQPDNEVCAIVDEKDCEKIEKLFDELNENKEDEEHLDAMYTSAILKLLAYIDKYSLSTIPTPDSFLSSAIMYINDNINCKITVDDVAKACHMSKYYFCRQFKKVMGLTVMDYILKSRIENAKNLLDTTSLPISEISEKCGFISCSYFSRIFKERLSKTPNEYRKRTPEHNA
jgi:AraC-like DNA-binding protein